jgi:hypothetical protein|tara:strand:+ start:163 stop:444 length:282 start_codon:yes stop_codon:yes gene_type:complete
MAKKNISSFLEKEVLNNKPRKSSRIDLWLVENPDKEVDLKEALSWFHDNQSSGFGWPALGKSLVKLDGWSDFPGDPRLLRYWAARNYPEWFSR